MKAIAFPAKSSWKDLVSRPVIDRRELDRIVTGIIDDVRLNGDNALRDYSSRFDGVSLKDIRVTPGEIVSAEKMIPPELQDAIKLAARNIEKFHRSQINEEPVTETMPGVKCWRRSVPVESAGIYVPGGTAPLFSTVLMLAIPARIAGCRNIVMCTPPGKDGRIDPVLLWCASYTGVTGIYRTGGAQAIAAMAYGTESVSRVDKIFGPGNQYVTRAKQLVQVNGTAIDMPAGPSELLVIADSSSRPDFIAADLISQAEHGTDSQVILLSDDPSLPSRVETEIEFQLGSLPRREIACQSLENSFSIVLGSTDECIEFSNIYAPEHLIINTADAYRLASDVKNAGSVFIGSYSTESAGDYASGTNHTLPTSGFARSYSGVSTESFMKRITYQEITGQGLLGIGKAIELMARAEKLDGHSNAVSVRLKALIDE